MEAGKSKIKVLADFIPDESSLSDLQMAPSCSVSFGREIDRDRDRDRERERELVSLPLLVRAPIPSLGPHHRNLI